jgi:6-phosphogluconolactonase
MVLLDMFEIAHFETQDVCMSYLLEEVDTIFIQRKNPYTLAMSWGSVLTILPAILDRMHSDITLEIYLVDERYVSYDDIDSNSRALWDILATYPRVIYHPFPIRSSAWESRSTYADMIEDIHFDLIILGAWPDGHTASLFPQSDALDMTESVLHTTTDRFAVHDRLTLSFERMREAGAIWLYFSWAKKSHIYEAFLDAKSDYHDIPAVKLREYKQAKVWYVR